MALAPPVVSEKHFLSGCLTVSHLWTCTPSGLLALEDIMRVSFMLRKKTREAVKYYYRLKFPHDENEWGRPHRTSPLHYRLLESGAVFGEKFGWERVNYMYPGQPVGGWALSNVIGDGQNLHSSKRLRQEHTSRPRSGGSV